MTIKDIIEKIKKELKNISDYNMDDSIKFTGKEVFDIVYDYLPDLEKANELQEEMISRLIKCYKHAHSENDIKFIEKITNKPWEEINER